MSPELTDLIRRFVDDRDSLADHEYEQLAVAAKDSPDVLVQIRDQLIIDETLSQNLTIDRRDFPAQVQQRIADHLRGESELNLQADELRSIALSRLGPASEARTTWSTIVTWSIALSLLVLVGVGVWKWRVAERDFVLATIGEVDGQVIIHRFPKANDEPAQSGQQLQVGDKLSVGDRATVTLSWVDGTHVEVSSGSVVVLPERGAGKRINLDHGEILAAIAKQPVGRPMVFATPHAEAIVRGTQLYLRVDDNTTRLDVTEGQVELVQLDTTASQLVAASESAIASPGEKLAKESLLFPASPEGLVYVFVGQGRSPLYRSKSQLRASKLVAQGENASFDTQGAVRLDGVGRFVDDVAARDLAQAIHAAQKMSLELAIRSDDVGEHESQVVSLSDGDLVRWSLMQVAGSLQLKTSDLPPIDLGIHLDPGKLSHVVITYDGQVVTTYFDGQRVYRANHRLQIAQSARQMVVGSANEQQRWHGRIQGLAIYDRALSAEEIQMRVVGQESK